MVFLFQFLMFHQQHIEIELSSYIIPVSCKLAECTYLFQLLFIDFIGFSTQTVMQSVSNESFSFLLSNLGDFYFFFLPTVLCRTSRMMLSRIGRINILVFFSILYEKTLSFTINYHCDCRYAMDEVQEIPFCLQFSESLLFFNQKWISDIF